MKGRPAPRLRYLLALPITTLLGYMAGRWLDAALGTMPWLALAGIMAGAVAGLWAFIREADPDLFRR